MARFGAQYPCFKPASAAAGVVLGKLVSANLRLNKSSAELYADDALAESDYGVTGANVDMELDDMTDDTAGTVYGQTVTSGELSVTTEDTAPDGILGYFVSVMRGGVRKYVARVYGHAKAQPGDEDAATRGATTSFQTTKTTFVCSADESTGQVYKQKTFDTIAAAKSYIETACAISP